MLRQLGGQMKTSGHDVLVTGGTRGIGLAVARKFREAGNRVLVTGRDVAKLTALEGEGFETTATDLADKPSRLALIAEVEARLPNLSVLVNNAGIQVEGVAGEDARFEDYEAEIEVNAAAPVHLALGLLPLLKARAAVAGEAAIVNVSSTLAIQPKRTAPVYCATKAFLSSFSLALGYQLEGSGVKVFDVLPPMVDTDMTAGRGSGKISPERMAAGLWKAFVNDRLYAPVGKAAALSKVNRVSPALARRLVKGG